MIERRVTFDFVSFEVNKSNDKDTLAKLESASKTNESSQLCQSVLVCLCWSVECAMGTKCWDRMCVAQVQVLPVCVSDSLLHVCSQIQSNPIQFLVDPASVRVCVGG